MATEKKLPPGWAGKIIRVNEKSNPKRPGTLAHKKFALLKDGMTVEESLAPEAEHAPDRAARTPPLQPHLDAELGALRAPRLAGDPRTRSFPQRQANFLGSVSGVV